MPQSNKPSLEKGIVLDDCDDAYSMTATLETGYNKLLNVIEIDIQPQCPINNHIRIYLPDVDALIQYLQETRVKMIR